MGPFRCGSLATEYWPMTESTSILEIRSRRHPVQFDSVTCWRLGSGELDRCRECVYLLRLEGATGRGATVEHVVCADDGRELEVPFAW